MPVFAALIKVTNCRQFGANVTARRRFTRRARMEKSPRATASRSSIRRQRPCGRRSRHDGPRDPRADARRRGDRRSGRRRRAHRGIGIAVTSLTGDDGVEPERCIVHRRASNGADVALCHPHSPTASPSRNWAPSRSRREARRRPRRHRRRSVDRARDTAPDRAREERRRRRRRDAARRIPRRLDALKGKRSCRACRRQHRFVGVGTRDRRASSPMGGRSLQRVDQRSAGWPCASPTSSPAQAHRSRKSITTAHRAGPVRSARGLRRGDNRSRARQAPARRARRRWMKPIG